MKKSVVATSLFSGLLVAGAVFAGDAAADKARAKQDREKAQSLLVEADKNDAQAVKDFDAAVVLEEKVYADRIEAHKLAHEAFLLDKEAGKETRINQLKGDVRLENYRAWECEHYAKRHAASANRFFQSEKDETKAEADLKAAEKAEPNAGRKALIQLCINQVNDEVKADQKNAKEQDDDAKRDQAAAKWHHDRAKWFETELQKVEQSK
jgi:hypothetical protein